MLNAQDVKTVQDWHVIILKQTNHETWAILFINRIRLVVCDQNRDVPCEQKDSFGILRWLPS